MPVLTPDLGRFRLLAGASVAALAATMAVAPARGQSLSTFSAAAGLSNAAINAAAAPAGSGQVLTASQASASMAALANAGRVTSGVSLARQANDAARAAAASLNSLVPNGLVAGGLVPVGNPVAAALDLTGLHTWQGAKAPTQATATDGSVGVTIVQTDARAILSWTSFNVGAKTTLTFDQMPGGTPQSDWVVLNRVVGGLDATGHRTSLDTASASQILGSIKAAGTVLLLNANGVLFGPTGQVNTRSLIVTSLEFGTDITGNLGLATRNSDFLRYGLLGKADEAAAVATTGSRLPTFATNTALNADGQTISDPNLEGSIIISSGATITTGDSGYALLFAPRVENSGVLSTINGQIGLASGRSITLRRSTDPADAGLIANPADSSIRGFLITTSSKSKDVADYVWNTPSGLIDATRGSALLVSTQLQGATLQDGIVTSTTSVARSGLIRLTGKDIRLGVNSILAVTPDNDGATIPQSPGSVAAFKVSRIGIGETDGTSRIEIDTGSLLYAPGGTADIGALPGPAFDTSVGAGRVFVDSGATIDVGGEKDVVVEASRNAIQISPVKGNELRDTPAYRNSFLNGAKVTVDPRRSGVRADGVAWIGSPLIEAGSYYEQVGVSAAELLTMGGKVTIGIQGKSDVTVRAGAKIDVSGGWVRYAAGNVTTTKLIDPNGAIVDIGDADPNVAYTGIASGFSTTIERFNTISTFSNPVIDGGTFQAAYTEGRDAGALTIKAASVVLDGSLAAQAFTGRQQIIDAQPGKAGSTLFADQRKLQSAPSQLPAGGFLGVQAFGDVGDGGGGDIRITTAAIPAGPAAYGQSVTIDAANGALNAVPDRPLAAQLSTVRQNTILLSDTTLSGLGLGAIALRTSGGLTVDAGANVTLQPGGVFSGLAGRRISIDGNITAAGGSISLETFDSLLGSGFVTTQRTVSSLDIVVTGKLSVRGRWVNDLGASADSAAGKAWLDGGSISLTGAANALVNDPTAPGVPIDVSGSILLDSGPGNPGARIDVAGGGYISPTGSFDLTARGGNLTLANRTTYFANLLSTDPTNRIYGLVSGFRVDANPGAGVVTNPARINARISIGDGAILAHGFGGGGKFALITPDFRLVGDAASISTAMTTGTALRTGFFSATGFADYSVTTYRTDLSANNFVNAAGVSRGGYNAVLGTTTVNVAAGQTLDLTESRFSPILTPRNMQTLQGLASGGDLYSVETPAVPVDAFDQRGIGLALTGLIELDVAPEIRTTAGALVQSAGVINGAAGASLTVAKLFNDGRIRLVGGTIEQNETLPSLYNGNFVASAPTLGEIFSVTRPDGKVSETTLNTLGFRDSQTNLLLTYGQLVTTTPVYLTGTLGRAEGVRLGGARASGTDRIVASVTDLSGAVLVDPRTAARSATDSTTVVAATVVAGGTLRSASFVSNLPALFTTSSRGQSPFSYGDGGQPFDRAGRTLVAGAGAAIDLSGAATIVDQRQVDGTLGSLAVWSDAGNLVLGGGGSLTGASVRAVGGAAPARGGTLEWLDPILVNSDAGGTSRNVVAGDVMASGFDVFIARGSLGADAGSATATVGLTLGRGFYVRSRANDGVSTTAAPYTPSVDVTGNLQVFAPYIRFDSISQTVLSAGTGTPGSGTATFTAGTLANPGAIDVGGAIVFGPSLGKVTLATTGDLRLIGANALDQTLATGVTVPNSLRGAIVANGDLTLNAAQIYPTTGTTFTIVSTGAASKISIGRGGTADPGTPYSAGGALTIQAANIDQGGIVRVPLGALTIGGRTTLTLGNVVVPGTAAVHLLDGSITSVSANGLSIPYGTTTDGIEYFFTPNNAAKLTAGSVAVLDIAGADVGISSGSKVDLSGGGDIYAYEFVPGTGGSRDVLDRFANDPFSSNPNPEGSAGNVQYPDGRQVYAIVPGLKSAVALYDPLYSSGYDGLYGPTQAGRSVYLDGGPGLAAGWYALMPAKYALLPGALRVVEQTGAVNALPDASKQLLDGSLVQTGYYGSAGTAQRDSTLRTFIVQPQSVFRRYSNITLTSGTQTFRDLATRNGVTTPRLPIDAGRLILEPLKSLALDGAFNTSPAAGGRGAAVDISGQAIEIVATANQIVTGAGANDIRLTADSLNALGAASLLVGGVRTELADGSTTLAVTAKSIIVANAGKPLSGPEILLATDGDKSVLDLRDGSAIAATGVAGTTTGNYIIDAAAGNTGAGGFVRVAQGSERLVTRRNAVAGLTATVKVGAVTLGGSGAAGTATLLDSSALLTINPVARLVATTGGTDALAIGAGRVVFATKTALTDALLVTPVLEANFATADRLTIRTPLPIELASGAHGFGDLRIDAPGFKLEAGSIKPSNILVTFGPTVTVNAKALTLSNTGGDFGICGRASPCGNGILVVNTDTLAFAGGSLHTYGLAGGTVFNASGGTTYRNVGGFDVSAGTLVFNTPFVVDRADAPITGKEPILPRLLLGALDTITFNGTPGASIATISGAPGSALVATSGAGHVDVAGTHLRATAGSIELNAATGIFVTAGAVIETPGYSRTFGDSADSYTVSAGAGQIFLATQGGVVATLPGTKISAGGGQGRGGSITLSAPGYVSVGGILDAAAPLGGGSLKIDSGGAFDLSAFAATAAAAGFSGTIDIRAGEGGLTLAAGQTLKAESIALTAEGRDGFAIDPATGLRALDANKRRIAVAGAAVDIAGTIDTSGVNGGAISLYGGKGVTLRSTATLDSHANGYGATDTRPASGGTVTLGSGVGGTLAVASGAAIDVGARRPGDRLVPMLRNGVTYYSYVGGDRGGEVVLRAPVDTRSGLLDINFAGSVTGASHLTLEAYRVFDLASIAANTALTGVSVANGTATLDVGQTVAGKLNFLADAGRGTLVDFIHNFDVSASLGTLGSFATSPVFRARPGVELNYSGNITLASNWNLGAGTVDIAGAVAAGDLQTSGLAVGKYFVPSGKEADLFANFTRLLYRVCNADCVAGVKPGSRLGGEPGVLSLRAGGNLTINGDITDGFFAFRDQTDVDYLTQALGGGPRRVGVAVQLSDQQIADTSVTWVLDTAIPDLANYAEFDSQSPKLFAPYSALANAPASRGSLPVTARSGSGDPSGTAELFPLLPGNKIVDSWGYRFTAGASTTASPLSVDPARAAAAGVGTFALTGASQYSFRPSPAGVSTAFDGNPAQFVMVPGTPPVPGSSLLSEFLLAYPDHGPDSLAYVSFPPIRKAALYGPLAARAKSFFDPGEITYDTGPRRNNILLITTTVARATAFLAASAADIGAAAAVTTTNLRPIRIGQIDPNTGSQAGFLDTATGTAPHLIRTGTGAITVTAATNVDLRNGAVPRLLGDVQLGGTAIYTAGHRAILDARTVVDASGISRIVDPSAFVAASDAAAGDVFTTPTLGAPADYTNGFVSNYRQNFKLLARPVYADGGGDVSVTAGASILGRRDASIESPVTGDTVRIGRVGQSDATTTLLDNDARINPQQFVDGIGALGGGDVSVTARRDITQLTVSALTSVVTAGVTTGTSATRALWETGGGDIAIKAGGNLNGGLVDAGRGTVAINVGGNVQSAGTMAYRGTSGLLQLDNALRLRIADASAAIVAAGSVNVYGITALGSAASGLNGLANYSAIAGVSIIANGRVTIQNGATSDVLGQTSSNVPVAIYPGSFEAASLTGNLSISPVTKAFVSMIPRQDGQLRLFAGGDIASFALVMEDADPGQLPGFFSSFSATRGAELGRGFDFPAVLPDTTDAQRRTFHAGTPIHAGDLEPVRIYAGGDIAGVIVNVAKQARIGAGRDIVDMVFTGQNLPGADTTRITAGRDIIATTSLALPVSLNTSGGTVVGSPLAVVNGNSFTIGGGGAFLLEAGRDAGPFLNSATVSALKTGATAATAPQSFGGGILSIGNDANPALGAAGADITVLFGIGKGAEFAALRETYLNPSNVAALSDELFVQKSDTFGNKSADRSQPIYGPLLINWVQANAGERLVAKYGTTLVNFQQAYDVFAALPALIQRTFLVKGVYFNELQQTSIPDSPSYLKYSRAYRAINILFPAANGYTANTLTGGAAGATTRVQTGNLDLRLATLQTQRGGDITILGPGGKILGGSTVRTADQAARRAYDGGRLAQGILNVRLVGGVPVPAGTGTLYASMIDSIPTGYEGILTLRGGQIRAFTDGDVLLNQSRLFSQNGGDITLFSANGDLNAGQGPKTSANFPPIVVRIDADGNSRVDAVGGVSGAGIAAFQPAVGVPAPNVYLIAPRGTVDAGDAGVRVAGNLFIAAQAVANADNFSVGGKSFGIPQAATVDVGATSSAGAAAAAIAQAASGTGERGRTPEEVLSRITVEVLGFVGTDPCDRNVAKRAASCPPIN